MGNQQQQPLGPVHQRQQSEYVHLPISLDKTKKINFLSLGQIYNELVINIFEADQIINQQKLDAGKIKKRLRRFDLVKQMAANVLNQQYHQDLNQCIAQTLNIKNLEKQRSKLITQLEFDVQNKPFQYGQYNQTIQQFFYPQHFINDGTNVIKLFENPPDEKQPDNIKREFQSKMLLFFRKFKDQFNLLEAEYQRQCQLRQQQGNFLQVNDLFIQENSFQRQSNQYNFIDIFEMRQQISDNLSMQIFNQMGQKQYIGQNQKIRNFLNQIRVNRQNQWFSDVYLGLIQLKNEQIMQQSMNLGRVLQQYQQYMMNLKKGFSDILFKSLSTNTKTQYYTTLINVIIQLQQEIQDLHRQIQINYPNFPYFEIKLVIGGGTGQFISLYYIRKYEFQGNLQDDQILKDLKDLKEQYNVGDLDCKIQIISQQGQGQGQEISDDQKRIIIDYIYSKLRLIIINMTQQLETVIFNELSRNGQQTMPVFNYQRSNSVQTYTIIKAFENQPRQQYSMAYIHQNIINSLHFSQIDLQFHQDQKEKNDITILRSFFKYDVNMQYLNQQTNLSLKLELIDISFAFSEKFGQRIGCDVITNHQNYCYCLANHIQRADNYLVIDQNKVLSIVNERTFKGTGINVQNRSKYFKIIISIIIICCILIFYYKGKSKINSFSQKKIFKAPR